MQRAWKQEIVFFNPVSTETIVLRDTAAAVNFFGNHWRWSKTPEFFAAARACYSVLDDGSDPEKAYAAVRIALESVGIRPL